MRGRIALHPSGRSFESCRSRLLGGLINDDLDSRHSNDGLGGAADKPDTSRGRDRQQASCARRNRRSVSAALPAARAANPAGNRSSIRAHALADSDAVAAHRPRSPWSRLADGF
jgi:hypothetical protein